MIIAELQKLEVTNDGPYGHIFEDVRMILRLLFPLKVSYGRRETNKAAHRLARLSLTK